MDKKMEMLLINFLKKYFPHIIKSIINDALDDYKQTFSEMYLLGFAEGLYEFVFDIDEYIDIRNDDNLNAAQVSIMTERFINKKMPVPTDALFLIRKFDNDYHPTIRFKDELEELKKALAKESLISTATNRE